eukprot:CAMPEP_0206286226 /NCGR_PEP_ID=MMETSP0106_2-20121207/494_1 /ASSEMBLY_ACC=CAM_ASM_000206 /TAXON_ID=81532 /ORGANISM="Acanthoeca-like sp., Strain 10tr" /LENGTH=496 /DNA_ID=CAMNT_0053716747 /DNA_START=490 /DNA_END=1977 /DNA_ORIENTATION=-
MTDHDDDPLINLHIDGLMDGKAMLLSGEDAENPVVTGTRHVIAHESLDDAPLLETHTEDGTVDVKDNLRSGGLVRRWAVLAVVGLIFVANHADRQLLAVLIPAGIACQIGVNKSAASYNDSSDCIPLNDTEIGVLLGPAFAVPFVIGGLPISWLADRKPRVGILAVCLLGWTTAVALMTLAKSFYALLFLRALVGVFEAGCNPCTYVMLSDTFPGVDRHRSVAFGIYHTGVYVGMGLAFFGAPLGEAVGWRTTFTVFGTLGYILLIGLVWLYFHDLPRMEYASLSTADDTLPPQRAWRKDSFTHVATTLLGLRRFRLLCLAASTTMLCRFSIAAYLPALYEHHFQLDPDEYGLTVGALIIVGGSMSSVIGGKLSDVVDTDRHRGLVCATSQWLPLPFWLGALIAPDKTVSFTCLFFAMLFGDAYLGVAVSMLQLAVPLRLRSRASMFYLGANTLGGGFGPLAVAIMIQFCNISVQEALVGISVLCLSLSGCLFFMS